MIVSNDDHRHGDDRGPWPASSVISGHGDAVV